MPLSKEQIAAIAATPFVAGVVTDVPPGRLPSEKDMEGSSEIPVQDDTTGDDEQRAPPRPTVENVVLRSTTVMTRSAWKNIIPETYTIIDIGTMWAKCKAPSKPTPEFTSTLRGKGVLIDV
jgi:hypothetical protein